MPTFKLTYFNGRGLAEPSRLIFAYTETPFEDIRIEKEEFAKKKETFPFGQLPILEVNGKVLAQSQAISRYLAKTFMLTGKDDWESAKCDMLVDGLADLRSHLRPFFREQDEEKKKAIWISIENEQIKPFLVKYEHFLVENGNNGHLVGEKLTWADLTLAEIFGDWNERYPHLMENHKKLVEYANKIRSIPQIDSWIKKRPKTTF